MLFGRKKMSAIDRRLEELQREMARVGTELKTVARTAREGGGEAPAPAGGDQWAKAPLPATGPGNQPPAASAPEDQVSSPGADTALPSSAGVQKQASFPISPGESAGDLPLFEQRSPLSMTGREKFANYFMAGHFANLRPLRQEKRIIRNKAIIWVVLVVLALVWLFFFMYYR